MKIMLFLMDQAPRIGSGMRIVELISEGPKWVHVHYWPGGPTAPAIVQKFTRVIWDSLHKRELPV